MLKLALFWIPSNLECEYLWNRWRHQKTRWSTVFTPMLGKKSWWTLVY